MNRRATVLLLLLSVPSLGPAQAPVPYGTGTPGAGGRVPVLAVDTDLYGGNSGFGLVATEALPETLGVLALSVGRADLDLGTLRVNVDPAGILKTVTAPVDGGGRAFVALPLPPLDARLIGRHVYFQAFVVDAAAPAGVSASRGLDVTILDGPRPETPLSGSVVLWFSNASETDSSATQTFLQNWGALTEHLSPCLSFRHVRLAPGRESPFVLAARAVLGVEVAERATWIPTHATTHGDPAFPDDPRYDSQWGLRRVEGPIFFGPNVPKVGVIDTGVLKAHEDFASAVGDDNGDGEPVGHAAVIAHGTHVAGILGAQADNARGVAGVADLRPGVAQTAWLRSLRVSVADSKYLSSAAIDDAISKAVCTLRLDVLNLSLGSLSPRASEAKAIAEAVRRGVVIVAASGNQQGSDPYTVRYPAAYDGVIAVGSTRGDDTRTPSSCYGGFLDLVAPGDSILSTWSTSSTAYATIGGTSMATPHVSAATALIWSWVADSGLPIPKRDYVRMLLYDHAVRTLPISSVYVGRGILDLSGELILSKSTGYPDERSRRGAELVRFPVRGNATLSSLAGDLGSTEITPDRQWIVFVRGDDIHKAARGAAPAGINLTNTAEREDGPVVTPDNRAICFVRRNGDERGIWSMDMSGGDPTWLSATVPDSDLHVSPDGNELVFAIAGEIRALERSSGIERVVRAFEDASQVWGHPRFSPDGQRIAADRTWWDAALGVHRSEVVILDPASGGFVRSIAHGAFVVPGSGFPYEWAGTCAWCPTWSPNGRYLYWLHSECEVGTRDEIRGIDLRTGTALPPRRAPHSNTHNPLGTPADCHPRLVSSRW